GGALAQPAALAVRSDAIDAVEARDIDLDARLGEREEVGSQADLALLAEDRAGERQQGPLEVRQGHVDVDGAPLELVELRGVRGVRVRAEHPAGHDDVDRWR